MFAIKVLAVVQHENIAMLRIDNVSDENFAKLRVKELSSSLTSILDDECATGKLADFVKLAKSCYSYAYFYVKYEEYGNV